MRDGERDDFGEVFDRILADLKSALVKLEVPGGPKITNQHQRLISHSHEAPWETSKEANEIEDILAECEESLESVNKKINDLSASTQSWLDWNSALRSSIQEDCFEAGMEFPFPSYLCFQAGMAGELQADLRDLREKIIKARQTNPLLGGTRGKRGRPTQVDANQLAVAVGEIFMELQGKLPTFGKDQDDEPSTPYCRAVDEVFRVLNIKSAADGVSRASFRGPCERAIEVLKEKERRSAR
ncbi:hypothetical protein [Shimia aestuarii]|uniref:hypothetical protein n=1 Tax=Shimia aestuarii TaxID=254406 RepID=UPI001FB480ED|nr:hypothetical protein [Shimia aestuarii]